MRTLLLLVLLFLACLCIGCSSSRLETATVPAEPPSVNVESDTLALDWLPPVPVRGVETLPQRVIRYDSLDAPSAEVQRVTFDPTGTLDILLSSGVQLEYKPPAHGESFDWLATTDSTGRAQVRGTPQDRDMKVLKPPDETSIWDRFVQALALIGFIVLAGLGIKVMRPRLLPF